MSNRVEGWNELGANEKVVMVMYRACSYDSYSPTGNSGYSLHATQSSVCDGGCMHVIECVVP